MAESNAMDRAQISALLDRAQHTINLAEQANNVLRLLKTPGTATVGDKGTLGTDTYLIPSRNITWPDNLYVNVFLDGMNAEATLTDYVASVAAIQGFPILSAYSTTKFAVRGLTQAAAQELAPKGHTVNAYAPGIVGTGMWEQIDAELSKINGKPIGENFKEYSSSIALGRPSVPEDVAGLVSFLASENSNYVTGQVMLVDGGMLYN